MANMHYATQSQSPQECNDMFFFTKALKIFSNGKKGIQHCGSLLSQQLLVIVATFGIFPVQFGTYGEIANTNS
eukprot:2821741-Ditylum_brightwellii.AAC.1